MKTLFDFMGAPDGARLTKADHPAAPRTPKELAMTARACGDAGAHVYVRNDQAGHSFETDRYQAAIRQIRAQTSLRIQISTEATDQFEVPCQFEIPVGRTCLAETTAIDASVSLPVMARDPSGLRKTNHDVAGHGISIQHILYTPDEVTQLLRRFDTGEIPQQAGRALFVLGRYTENQISDPAEIAPFLKPVDTETLNWSACAFGASEQACLLAALDHGDDVRVGFENNCIAPSGALFPDNAASVAALAEAADKAGFQPEQVFS